MTQILNAAPVREKEIGILKEKCRELKKRGVTPTMKVLLVGEHPPSVIYTRNKKKFIESIGGECEIIRLASDVSADKFKSQVAAVAEDKSVHGCFIQLPLPAQLAGLDISGMIPPHKDVDGFHPHNLNALLRGDIGHKALIPCTPKGIITLLQYYGITIAGKSVAILGRSTIVGKPMALLILNCDGTPTICHSKSSHIKEICRGSDIIISAVGKAKFLDDSFIGKNKPVVIDVGINHQANEKLCGDVNFEATRDLCSAISPVPGGVGPMTVLSLAQNLITAAETHVA